MFTYYSEYLLDSEPEASDFSGETSSSFEFSFSNSADSNEEVLVSVDSTVEPYQFVPVGASTSPALDSDGDERVPIGEQARSKRFLRRNFFFLRVFS